MWTYGKETVIKSIVVHSFKSFYYSEFEFDAILENFYESEKGIWVKNNSVAIEKKLTYDADGDSIVNVTAHFSEPKYNFFILKWL